MLSESEQTIIVNLSHLVPPDHILRRLKDMFPWEEWARPFENSFKGGKEYGPKGYPVSVLLKMTVLSHLYALSDHETETFVAENLPARYFIGMSLLQPVPDETTLCRFRNRIVARRMDKALQELFKKILHKAHDLGISFGRVQVLDSVHTESRADKAKESSANKKLEKDNKPPKPPCDPDASWGCKGTFKVKDPETGEKQDRKKWFHGYKTHVSLNQGSRLVTSLLVSTGKDNDSQASRILLSDDMAKGLKPTVVTADKGYDDIDLYTFCGNHNIFPAVALRTTRCNQKSKKNSAKWEDHKKMPFYKKALGLRYKIEAAFGQVKQWQRFGKCRYFGLNKFMFQSIFTFLTMNLKRIVKLIPAHKIKRDKLCYE